MTRYKGKVSYKTIESAFPHHVDMAVPDGGFEKRLDDMYRWHSARGIQAIHGSGRREDGRDYIRWCFADPVLAAEFAKEFGVYLQSLSRR